MERHKRSVMDHYSFSTRLPQSYLQPGDTVMDIKELCINFTDLRCSTDKPKFFDGDLLAIRGTIPVTFNGSCYNIPIGVWPMPNHPTQTPVVMVLPTSTMGIMVDERVNREGFVDVSSLWKQSNGLVDIVSKLCEIFSRNPPVHAVKTPSTGLSASAIRRLVGSTQSYVRQDETAKHVTELCEAFSDLRCSTEERNFHGGSRQTLLAIQGTVPVIYARTRYNIPIGVWPMPNHPTQTPVVMVLPTSTMKINVADRVDQDGFVEISSLWQQHKNLAAAVNLLCTVFGQTIPVYKLPTSITDVGAGVQEHISTVPTLPINASSSQTSVSSIEDLEAGSSSIDDEYGNTRITSLHTRQTQAPDAPVFQSNCLVCEQDNVFDVTAMVHCKDCCMDMCNPCLVSHNKFPANRRHQIKDV